MCHRINSQLKLRRHVSPLKQNPKMRRSFWNLSTFEWYKKKANINCFWEDCSDPILLYSLNVCICWFDLMINKAAQELFTYVREQKFSKKNCTPIFQMHIRLKFKKKIVYIRDHDRYVNFCNLQQKQPYRKNFDFSTKIPKIVLYKTYYLDF